MDTWAFPLGRKINLLKSSVESCIKSGYGVEKVMELFGELKDLKDNWQTIFKYDDSVKVTEIEKKLRDYDKKLRSNELKILLPSLSP